MTGRTGCGICGIDDIEALRRARGTAVAAPSIAVTTIARALRDLDDRQVLNLETRAVHGAAWADGTGEIQAVREDVGRHNALDKLIGAMLRAATDPADGFALITSRCSFEMVEKVATFGAAPWWRYPRPTSLAIERARALDLTLIALARRDTLTVFNGASASSARFKEKRLDRGRPRRCSRAPEGVIWSARRIARLACGCSISAI